MSRPPAVQGNIRLLFWAELVGATNFLMPVATLFYLHRGLEYHHIFGMLLTWVITVFIAEIPTGAIADKSGPKRAFMIGHAFIIISNLILLWAQGPTLFYVSSACSALGFTFFSGSQEAFLFETLKDLKQEDAMSSVSARIHSARFIPATLTLLLGAWLARNATEAQFQLLILLGLAFNGIRFVLLAKLIPPTHYQGEVLASHREALRAGWQNLRGKRDLWLLVTNCSLVIIPTYFLIADYNLAQVYLVDSGLPIAALGIVYAIASGLTASALNLLKSFEKRFGRLPLMHGLGILIALTFILGIFGPQIPAVTITVFLLTKTAVFMRDPLFLHYRNGFIPSRGRATSLSLLSMADSAFDVVIISSMGYFSTMGIQRVFMGCLIFIVIGICIPIRPGRAAY